MKHTFINTRLKDSRCEWISDYVLNETTKFKAYNDTVHNQSEFNFYDTGVKKCFSIEGLHPIHGKIFLYNKRTVAGTLTY